MIAATHRDLEALVAGSEFREDLYYRLAEIVVELPPLRERPSDIGPLAHRLLSQAGGGRACAISDAAVAWLTARDFPGNVRELRNVIRRACVLAEGSVLEPGSFETAERMTGRAPSVPPMSASDGSGTVDTHSELPIKRARDCWMEVLERRYLEALLRRFGEDVGAIAAHMGLHRKSVFRLLRAHGLMDEP